MLEQHLPWYLGMAMPYTLPIAVGGFDLEGMPRWRRPTWEEVECYQRYGCPAQERTPHFSPFDGEKNEVEAAQAKLFDVTRGLAQRIEGQYRRHWSFVPGLWNLYFREQINLGISLKAPTAIQQALTAKSVEVDAAIAAAELHKLLIDGTYTDARTGKKQRIDKDVSKLPFADGITQAQKFKKLEVSPIDRIFYPMSNRVSDLSLIHI